MTSREQEVAGEKKAEGAATAEGSGQLATEQLVAVSFQGDNSHESRVVEQRSSEHGQHDFTGHQRACAPWAGMEGMMPGAGR